MDDWIVSRTWRVRPERVQGRGIIWHDGLQVNDAAISTIHHVVAFSRGGMVSFRNDSGRPDRPRGLPLTSILIIDDSKFLCAVLRDTLEKSGYKATTVNTVIDAVKYLKVESPDLILLDINLPGTVQGNEACKMLKNSPKCKAVPIVLMSGASEEEMARKQQECGADSFICKPFTPPQILEWLRNHDSLLQRKAEAV